MKIQVGSKGEVAWDVVLEALRKEELLEATYRKNGSCISQLKRCISKCFDHRVIFVLLMTICILLYGLMYWVSLKLSSLRNQSGHVIYDNGHGKLYHIHFSWTDCGNPDDPMKLSKLQVAPDPVHLDRNITIDMISSLKIDIDKENPLSASVTVERRLGWIWVEIPCVFGLGSCYYKDVCAVIPFPPADPCPDPFPRFNIPCHCPISHGNYDVRNGTFSLSAILSMFPLPEWLVSGDYYIKISAIRNGAQLGCYEIYSAVVA